MKRLLFLFLPALLLIFTACSNSGSTTEANEPKFYNLNEEAVVGSTGVILYEIGYSTFAQMSYGVPVNAPEGKNFLYTAWGVVNGGDSEISISSQDFNCYIDNTQVPESIYTNSITDGFPSIDTLNSGRTVQGFVLFEVPTEWTTLELEFKPNIYDNDSVVYKVSKAQAKNLNAPQ